MSYYPSSPSIKSFVSLSLPIMLLMLMRLESTSAFMMLRQPTSSPVQRALSTPALTRLANIIPRSPDLFQGKNGRSIMSATNDQTYRTIVPVPPSPSSSRIQHQDQIVLIGSCFSENIGQKLHHYKYKVDVNPFGISFNPVSIIRSLDRLISGKPYEENDLGFLGGCYFSFDHHTSFSKQTAQETLEGMNKRLAEGHQALLQAEHLFITLGTSYAFVYHGDGNDEKAKKKNAAAAAVSTAAFEEGDGQIVANCHKLNSKLFTRRLLGVKEIVDGLVQVLQKLKRMNPEVSITFTVSPVRHWKDGPIENSRSKAHLIAAVHQVIDRLGPSWASYYPSYEIMMDDLRDYRFYDVDMLHPSPQAVDYVWSRLVEAKFDDNPVTLSLMQQIDALHKALQHRPFDPDSKAHQAFLKSQLEAIRRFESARPYLNFKQEKAALEKVLIPETSTW